MGSRVGYEYGHRFSMVDLDEINSKYKTGLIDGVKAFIFEFRTNFILKRRPEEGVADAIMDYSERHDARVYDYGDGFTLFIIAAHRLREYWMTEDEILWLLNEAFDFAKQMAADPQHASLRVIPIVVGIDVCSMQQEGESFGACMDRAIRAQNLVPLYLWPLPTAVRRKPMTHMLLNFLRNLRRIRVENIDEGLALMQVCPICSRKTSIGAQISLLPCDHAFHSHCIVRWLEDNNLCPSCDSPAYDHRIAVYPSLRVEVGNAIVESLDRMKDESKRATLQPASRNGVQLLTVDFFQKLC